jgi:hypothetical protein
MRLPCVISVRLLRSYRSHDGYEWLKYCIKDAIVHNEIMGTILSRAGRFEKSENPEYGCLIATILEVCNG